MHDALQLLQQKMTPLKYRIVVSKIRIFFGWLEASQILHRF